MLGYKCVGGQHRLVLDLTGWSKEAAILMGLSSRANSGGWMYYSVRNHPYSLSLAPHQYASSWQFLLAHPTKHVRLILPRVQTPWQ